MTLQQLEYFVSAAHNLNFSKTAEMFFVSQSAITQQIRSLEKELKLDLFIRKNNRISLTDSGIYAGSGTDSGKSQRFY